MLRFSSKRSLTLLVVTDAEVARADFAGEKNPAVKSFARAQRPENVDVTTAVEMALGLIDAKPSQRTVVLAEEFWTGVLDVDDRSIYGLEGDELGQMLKFETEGLSHLEPMHSQLGFAELAAVSPDTRRFWCTGVAGEVLHAIGSAVSLRGGKLALLANPLGLCGPEVALAASDSAGGAAGPAWVEFRGGVAGAFASTTQGRLRASIAPRGRQSDRWLRGLESGFGGPLPAVGWLTADAEAPEEYAASLQTLGSEASLQAWCGGVARRLAGTDPLPRVLPPAAETSSQTLQRAGVAAAVLAAALCGLDYLRDSSAIAAIEQEIVDLEEPAAEKQRLETELKKIGDQIAALNTELSDVEDKRSKLAGLTANRDRFSELLRLIAANRDAGLVVDEIAVEPSGLQLSGRAIESDAATRLATGLDRQVGPIGWRVAAPELTGENKTMSGGPWRFSIDLIDAAPAADDAGQPVAADSFAAADFDEAEVD